MQAPFRLDGKKALVTGGASGIGEAICRVFTNAGASLLIADINEAQSAALASELGNATPVACDITDESSVREMFAAVDRLDILVNNAGIGLVGGVEETTLDDFQRIFRVNVDGTILGNEVRRSAFNRISRRDSQYRFGGGLDRREEALWILCDKRRDRRHVAATCRGLSYSVPRELHLSRYRRFSLRRRLPGQISQA